MAISLGIYPIFRQTHFIKMKSPDLHTRSYKNTLEESQKNYYTCSVNAGRLQDLNVRVSTMSFGDNVQVQYTAKRTKQGGAQKKPTDDKTRRCEIDGRQDKTDETNLHRTETPDSDASNAPDALALHLAQPQRSHKRHCKRGWSAGLCLAVIHSEHHLAA